MAAADRALDRHPGAKHTGDKFAARLATEGAKFARLKNKRVAANGPTDSANDCPWYSFTVALFHDKCASQGIGNGRFACPLDAV